MLQISGVHRWVCVRVSAASCAFLERWATFPHQCNPISWCIMQALYVFISFLDSWALSLNKHTIGSEGRQREPGQTAELLGCWFHVGWVELHTWKQLRVKGSNYFSFNRQGILISVELFLNTVCRIWKGWTVFSDKRLMKLSFFSFYLTLFKAAYCHLISWNSFYLPVIALIRETCAVTPGRSTEDISHISKTRLKRIRFV